jgi:hypothetical protein
VDDRARGDERDHDWMQRDGSGCRRPGGTHGIKCGALASAAMCETVHVSLRLACDAVSMSSHFATATTGPGAGR